MKTRILETLNGLRNYALSKGYAVDLFYHEEDSYLMRFANSAISLNTNEHLIRLSITAYQGKQRASYELITNLSQVEEMQRGIDTAAEMAQHAQPLSYQPSMPQFSASFSDETGYDEELATMSNSDRLLFFNKCVSGLENGEIRLSGIFSNGANTYAQISTASEHTQYCKTSDAQVTVVLSHNTLKWEVNAEQSAHKASALDPNSLKRDLTFLLDHYQQDTPQQIPTGRYDIVFGAQAIAEMLYFMNYIAFNGGALKRGYSFLSEEHVGKRVLSAKFNLVDEPSRLETFPLQRDFMGMPRKRFGLFDQGVFKGFTWSQDDADEFGQQPTGHTVTHKSLVMGCGDHSAPNLQALASQERESDLLYIPYLHYMNIVNPSKALVTGSSRFGALLLKRDGSIVVPYNVRLTQSLLDLLGERVAWIAQETKPYNVSSSYGARNPTAIIVPKFMRVNGLEISHTNSSY